MKKTYWALVAGVPPLRSGTCRESMARHPQVRVKMAVASTGKHAHTDWQSLANYGSVAALIGCYPLTGRTHQIRVHLSHAGYPILGDCTYGYRPNKKLPLEVGRVMLHASELSFMHPFTQLPLALKAPLPEDFKQLIHALEEFR